MNFIRMYFDDMVKWGITGLAGVLIFLFLLFVVLSAFGIKVF